jgi:pimeloyl-ACP methyl ester carboxylesterase
MGMDLGADVFVRQSEALRLRGDRREAIAALHMPVLYLCGEEDTLCPPAWHQIWTNLTPKSQFKEISGAGHMLPLEAPTAFAATIENWLTINEKEFA